MKLSSGSVDMIKLPTIQSANETDVDGCTSCAASERMAKPRDSSSSTRGPIARSWHNQAKVSADDSGAYLKYKSVSVQAEVKLLELLDKCLDRQSRLDVASSSPDKIRTALCCTLLAELADVLGPFKSVISIVQAELVRAIYSQEYSSETGDLMFDQLPWFSVAHKLGVEKERLQKSVVELYNSLEQNQTAMDRIEHQVALYRGLLDSSEAEIRSLRAQIRSSASAEEAAHVESRAAREELKRLRKELLRAKDEMESSRVALLQLQLQQASEAERSQQLVSERNAARLDAEEALAAAAQRLTVEQSCAMEEALQRSEQQLAVLRQELGCLQGQCQELSNQLEAATPRPDWSSFVSEEGQPAVERSRCRAAELLLRDEERRALQSQLLLATALAAPEPQPAPWELVVIAEECNYFVTEAQVQAQRIQPLEWAEALGLSSNVPRLLRWSKRIELHAVSAAACQQRISTVIQEKRVHDLQGRTSNLLAFLYDHLRAFSPLDAEVVSNCYSFYYSLTQHSATRSRVRAFWLVLTGQLPESLLEAQELLLQELVALVPSDIAKQGWLRKQQLKEMVARILHQESITFQVELAKALDVDFQGDVVDITRLTSLLAQCKAKHTSAHEYSALAEFLLKEHLKSFEGRFGNAFVRLRVGSTDSKMHADEAVKILVDTLGITFEQAACAVQQSHLASTGCALQGTKRLEGLVCVEHICRVLQHVSLLPAPYSLQDPAQKLSSSNDH